MDILDDEMLRLWRSLDQNKVRYIMVGGFATNLHGFSRTTADLDLWIDDNEENRQNLIEALSAVGLSKLESLIDTQLIPGWTTIKLASGFELDIMTSLKGFDSNDFNDCFKVAAEAEIHDITIRFLHLNHLIKSKEATNRPKDQLDLIELKKIRNQSTQ
ncbi:hypothetical protein N8911_00510 [bacterium]|nr:hypothetical protein [bacterium]